ncbi:MAG: ROK family protein, partial [Clostridia bacterium]|nr:ROK family protein [Clostridia bacterium]
HPEAVLIGGGVSAAGDALMAPLREKVKTLIYGVADYAPVQILKATLGNDAGMFGAACLAMEK